MEPHDDDFELCDFSPADYAPVRTRDDDPDDDGDDDSDIDTDLHPEGPEVLYGPDLLESDGDDLGAFFRDTDGGEG